ncbi:MAG: hypothetical protein GY810_11720 [Aureispira sp.]|nr:hypothetical protein [Aureispira sp.]
MNASQQINHINENNYDVDISVTDVPKGHFTAVTANSFDGNSSLREIRVEILPLEQHQGGTVSTNSGLFVKGDNENAIQVKIYKDGQEVASNTQSY